MDPRNLRRAVQEEIQEVLRSASARGPRLDSELVSLGARHDIDPFRAALFLLTSLDRPDPFARTLLTEIDARRADIEIRLGRDVGLMVAALDRLEEGREEGLGQPVFRGSDRAAAPDGIPPGVLDAERWRAAVRDEMRRGERFGRPLAVILLAPVPGPLGGDRLATCAAALCEAARDTDQVGILPAERCGVLLPCTRGPEAALVADRLRRAVGAGAGAAWGAGVASCEDRPWLDTRLMEQAKAALGEILRAGAAATRRYHPERRGHPRRPVGPTLLASLREEGQETDVLVEDLSLGGALIASPRRVVSGHGVVLAIREAAPRSHPLRLASRVVREVPSVGPEETGPYRAAVAFLGDATERLRVAALLADLRGPVGAGEESSR